MRTTIIFLFVLTICPVINSDDLIDELQQDIIRREFFQLVKTTKIRAEYMSHFSPTANDLPYSVGTILGNEEFNLIYYDGYNRTDGSIISVVELFGQRFSFDAILMCYGNFFLFEHSNKKYILWVDSIRGSNGWTSFYLLSDITDRNNVKTLIFGNQLSFEDDNFEVGLFPNESGVLCTIITRYSDYFGGTYRTRLYAISDRGLDEVLDNNGRNIELYYNWSKWEHWNVEIVYRNIPQDLNVSELSFRTVYFFNEQGAID
jgi:hypothetical protein